MAFSHLDPPLLLVFILFCQSSLSLGGSGYPSLVDVGTWRSEFTVKTIPTTTTAALAPLAARRRQLLLLI